MFFAKLENIFLFLTILFLPTQLGKHFWPDFSYIYSLKIDYLSPTIYFWDLLVISLVIIWILNKGYVNKFALSLLFIFILTQALSLIGQDTEIIGRGLLRLEQYLLAGLFGVYIASIKLDKKLLLPFTIAILFETFLGVAQFIKGGTFGFWILGERNFSISTPGIAKFDFYGLQFLRPYATFPHPNVLAAFMVIATIILSSLRKQGSINKIVNWIPAFAGMTIVLTFSRTAILAGVISALILLNKRWKIIFLVLTLVLLPILYTRFQSAFNFDVLSLIRREEQSLIAWQLFLEHPFAGVGLNNFIPAASDELLAGPSRFLQPVHNIFLLTLAETGILGLLGLFGLIGYPIVRLFKLRTLLLIWGIILFLGLFDHYFLTLPQGYRLLFLVWGISISAVQLSGEKYR